MIRRSSKKICDRIAVDAAAGMSGLALDDEITNRIFDKIDYSEAVKKLFKTYTAEHGLNYMDPAELVRSKEAHPKLYRAWVDFKCARVAHWYELYRAAQLAAAPAGTRPLLITHIQGARDTDPEQIKFSNFLDYRLLAGHCDYISTMAYTYAGVKQSAQIGDFLEMFCHYVGKDVVNPLLLAGYDGADLKDENRVMLKYQMFEALLQKSRLILFWKASYIFEPLNAKFITDAIRQCAPYETLILNGKRDGGATAAGVRIKALRHGNELLLLLTDYTARTSKPVTVKLNAAASRVLRLADGAAVPLNSGTFQADLRSDRGQLFLVTLK